MTGEADVTPDGSPVEVYLRRSPGDVPRLIHEAIPPGASVLDLGCGVGRLARPLAELGHRVTGVDESAEMLARAVGFETVQARFEDLDLGRRFDAVMLASHFVNVPDARQRRQLLALCRRYVSPDGAVLVERFEPGWVQTAVPGPRPAVDGVETELHDLCRDGEVLSGRVTYRVGAQVWTQRFAAVDMDDARLAEEAEPVGLRVADVLDARRTWVLLAPV